ncbi:MAG: putative lipoic acid synthase [Circular genetic element sp.]|nr:MAG: putative lipoic acid synthase [Circular genetic element sp.]
MMTPGIGIIKCSCQEGCRFCAAAAYLRSKTPTPPFPVEISGWSRRVIRSYSNPESILFWTESPATRARVYVQARTKRNEY